MPLPAVSLCKLCKIIKECVPLQPADARRGWPMESFKNQLKQVLRRLGRTPMFTAITLITLAAGVGANTVVFSVLEGVLLRALALSQPR